MTDIATAAAKHPELGDGYPAALTNFAFIANAVLTTADTVKAIEEGVSTPARG